MKLQQLEKLEILFEEAMLSYLGERVVIEQEIFLNMSERELTDFSEGMSEVIKPEAIEKRIKLEIFKLKEKKGNK